MELDMNNSGIPGVNDLQQGFFPLKNCTASRVVRVVDIRSRPIRSEYSVDRTKDSIVFLMLFSFARIFGAVARSDSSREQRVFHKRSVTEKGA